MSVIQFKVEGQLIREHPEFHLDSRNLLHLMNCETGTIEIQGHTYELLDTNFPTVDWKDPYALTKEEEEIMERLEKAFAGYTRMNDRCLKYEEAFETDPEVFDLYLKYLEKTGRISYMEKVKKYV